MMNKILRKIKFLTLSTVVLSAAQLNAAGFIGQDYLAVSGSYTNYDNDYVDDSTGLSLNYNHAFSSINTDLVVGAFLGEVHFNHGWEDADSKVALLGLRSFYDVQEKTRIFAEFDFSRQKYKWMGPSSYDSFVHLSAGAEFLIGENLSLTPYLRGSKNTDGGDWAMDYGILGDYDFSEKIGGVVRLTISEDSDVGVQLGCKIKL